MERIYIHPLPVRIWHWANAVAFLLMIGTGARMRYPQFVHVLPFTTAYSLHEVTGFILIACYGLWLGYHVLTGKIREYVSPLVSRQYVAKCIEQVRYYTYGMFVGARDPHTPTDADKFNPLQATLYLIVMAVLVPIQLYTGILLWGGERFSTQMQFFGGTGVIDTVHVVLFVFFIAYILVHIPLGALGNRPFAHYKAMFTGFEDMEQKPGGRGTP
jgi:thiosulfate reductase cytochrome b subunit